MWDYKFRVSNKELKEYAESIGHAPIVAIGSLGFDSEFQTFPGVSDVHVIAYNSGQFGWNWDAFRVILTDPEDGTAWPVVIVSGYRWADSLVSATIWRSSDTAQAFAELLEVVKRAKK